MRIAFDYQTFVGQSYGGISRYFTRLAQGLLDMEQEVGVFAPLHRNSYLLALPQEIVHGKHVNRYPPKTARFLGAYNRIRSQFQMDRWHPDLVHETYYSKVRTAPSRCPVVITVHDMIPELFHNEFSVSDDIAVVKRRAFDRADHVICVSENTKLDLMRLYGTSASNISVVHHGIDQLLSPAESRLFITPSGKPFILYVGHRGGYKNFMGFLKTVAASTRLLSDFDVVAFGGAHFSSVELSQISALGFAENQVVYMNGSDALLGNLYSSARAFVYPSLYEGFGIPPLEAMAHQCPVICSNTSSLPEVVGKAGEYFNPVDNDDMLCAIESVVYSESRIDFLKKLGAERLNIFSWAKCAHETLNIYHSLT